MLAHLFGAHLHFTGAGDAEWGALEIAREALTDELDRAGPGPPLDPDGGQHGDGCARLRRCVRGDHGPVRCARAFQPQAIVITSSSGGTHAGLVAGRALRLAAGHIVPDIVAIGVARGVVAGMPSIGDLARDTLALLGADPSAIRDDDTGCEGRWLGADYAVPTTAGDEAVAWAARHGGWVLDRTYTAKGFSGLLRPRRRGPLDRRRRRRVRAHGRVADRLRTRWHPDPPGVRGLGMPRIDIPAGEGPEATRAMALAPHFIEAINAKEKAVWQSPMPRRLHELVRMRVAEINGCVLCMQWRNDWATRSRSPRSASTRPATCTARPSAPRSSTPSASPPTRPTSTTT